MSTPATSSTHTARCNFNRLHRNTTQSPDLDDCKKRKLQKTNPQIVHPAEPATKKRRGRPSKRPATPVSQGATASSGSRSSLPTRRRYSLRSQGQLPTPEPSQQQTPETEVSSENDIESVAAGSVTPPQHHTPAQDQELDDIIMVDNSIIASSVDGNNTPDQTHTPDDASIVRETPVREQPGSEVADVQDHLSPFVRRGRGSENPFVNHTPIINRFSRRLGSDASDREENNVHYATRGGQDRDYRAEADALRASRTALRENLEASTALVHTLQNRLLQREGDTMAERALLTQAQADLADTQAQIQGVKTSVVRLGSTLAVFVFGVAAYAAWTWVNGPEFQYIRKRRADFLME